MQKKKFHVLNPRLDANFKAIFTQPTPESRNALRSFLTAAIGREVTDVTVKENENAKEFDTQRGLRYDINCEFDDGTLAQVEMQGYDEGKFYGSRAEYYVSRLLSTSLDVGDEWGKISQAYQISVLDCIFDKSHDDFFHHYTMTDIKDGSKLADRLNVIFLELPKLPPIDDKTNLKNLPSITKWCKFLKEADNPKQGDLIDTLAKAEEGIMNATKTLNNISEDRWRWIIQGQIEGRERDARTRLHDAERRGLEQGRSEAARENARNLLKLGVAEETVAVGCSLPLEEVQKIAEKMPVEAESN